MDVVEATRGTRVPEAVAGLACAALAALVLLLVGSPIDTNDFWFHAKMGEVYATQGLWPDSEPLLHTAHETAPVQHEWLFGVVVHVLEQAIGFHGLRVVHVLVVAGILWLVASLFRRESGSSAVAFMATCVFLVLSLGRLVQLRPDLVSIPATFALYRLLLESGEVPSWKRVALACGLSLFWVNAHSLFSVGPALLVAALLGIALRAGVTRWAGLPGREDDLRLARRVGAALLLIVVATLANPRGPAQHLTFFTSSSESAIWSIGDEWTGFVPLDYGEMRARSQTSFLAWIVADALFLGWLVALLVGGVAVVRERSARALRAVDPMLLGLGLASLVAVLVSVRFLWMLIFPLLFLVRALSPTLRARPGLRLGATWVASLLAVVLVLAAPRWGGIERRLRRLPDSVREYLWEPWARNHNHVSGVEFLAETQLEGRLFNRYTMGGFLGYWLSPRLRTFVDGRTEHYAAEVLDDYFRISDQREVRPGETWLEALDRYGVDVYFGVGLPALGERVYTTARLERVPGWRLVFRAPGHGIYLRANERNQENLRRVNDFYAREGVPFDPERGFDPDAVVREAPEWAIRAGVLPPAWRAWIRERGSADESVRFTALEKLGLVYALLGAYDEQIAVDREADGLGRREPQLQRRLVFGLLHEGRVEEALVVANDLALTSRADERSQSVVAIARKYTQRERAARRAKFQRDAQAYIQRRRESSNQREERWLVPPETTLTNLRLLTPAEVQVCCREFY